MTDVKPPLTDVWDLFIAAIGREPIQVKVLGALALILVALMCIDGICANLARKKPLALEIIREPHAKSVPYAIKAAAPRPGARLAVKKAAPRPSRHKPVRPGIRRFPVERTVAYAPSPPPPEPVAPVEPASPPPGTPGDLRRPL